MEEQLRRSTLGLVAFGHVDVGKSTLLGHLLFQCGAIPPRTMRRLHQDAEAMGKASFAFAWQLDRTRDERERGITITTHTALIPTVRHRVTLIDTPGHRDFARNMIVGLTAADAGLLVVALPEGEFLAGMDEITGKTREYATTAFAVGLRQLIVAVNKMDAVGYAQEPFERVRSTLGVFLQRVGFRPEQIQFVPVSGWAGDNLSTTPPASSSSTRMPWYEGPTLVEAIDALEPPTAHQLAEDKPLRVSVRDVFKILGCGTVVCGRIETGVLRPGQMLSFGPARPQGRVVSLEQHHCQLPEAGPGMLVGINVKGVEASALERGYVASNHELDPVRTARTFTAQIVLLALPEDPRLGGASTNVGGSGSAASRRRLGRGYSPIVHCHAAQSPCRIAEIKYQVDRRTEAIVATKPEALEPGNAYVVVMEPQRPLCVEAFREYPSLGRLVIRDMGMLIGVGFVKAVDKAP